MKRTILALLIVLVASLALAQDALQPKLMKSEAFNKRPTEWFQHGTLPQWESKNANQKDEFIVVHPKTGDASGRPLYVVLHSAGHSGQTALDCTLTPGNHDIYHVPDNFYALFVDCRANQPTDWWWGDGKQSAPGALTPVEKRVMDTVQWTIKTYKIDPNRVYLCGNSMGGSGTLGLGMRHGDVFAAIKANVPARVTHVCDRMYFTPEGVPAGVTLPEPPVCFDYSAPNDNWSQDHDIFFKYMAERRYAVVAYWGPFGHANNHEKIKQLNDLIETFDWTAIRKNAAYPVFLHASTDTVLPWPDHRDSTVPGQINAYFRWENVSDTAQKLEMNLYLASKSAIGSRIFEVPTTATTDVCVRRVQNAKLVPGQKVRWTFGSRTGTATLDKDGTFLMDKLEITSVPTRLTISWK